MISRENPLELPPLTPRTEVSSTFEFKGDNTTIYDPSSPSHDQFDPENMQKSDGVHVFSVKTLHSA